MTLRLNQCNDHPLTGIQKEIKTCAESFPDKAAFDGGPSRMLRDEPPHCPFHGDAVTNTSSTIMSLKLSLANALSKLDEYKKDNQEILEENSNLNNVIKALDREQEQLRDILSSQATNLRLLREENKEQSLLISRHENESSERSNSNNGFKIKKNAPISGDIAAWESSSRRRTMGYVDNTCSGRPRSSTFSECSDPAQDGVGNKWLRRLSNVASASIRRLSDDAATCNSDLESEAQETSSSSAPRLEIVRESSLRHDVTLSSRSVPRLEIVLQSSLKGASQTKDVDHIDTVNMSGDVHVVKRRSTNDDLELFIKNLKASDNEVVASALWDSWGQKSNPHSSSGGLSCSY